MTITFPLAMPAYGIQSISPIPLVAAATARDPFLLKQEVQMHQGEIWQFNVSLVPMERVDAAPWIGFLLSLRGPKGTFLMSPEDAREPQGVATGTPLVAGADQSGITLLTDGWTPSTAGILKAGDYISIGSGEFTRLYQVTADADSDGLGAAELDIFPRLREVPADNDPITLSDPAGTFRLATNQMPYNVSPEKFYTGFDFSCAEAW